jgi:GNAT superfamily N-acetyltransferase
MELEIRRVGITQLSEVMDWAEQEGWNPGRADAECFFETDPEGFFMAFVNGIPAGSICAVSYGVRHGFIGLFIVRPELRGGRIGIELGRKALDRLAGRTIGIDGVEAKIKNYQAFGFRIAYNNVRYEGVTARPSMKSRALNAEDVPFKRLSDYDSSRFFTSRPAFLSRWIRQPSGAALVLADGGKISGFGVIRLCRKGYKIGPLFAEGFAAAEELFLSLQARVPAGSPFFMDIPGANDDALKLVCRYRMRPVFKTVRMYNSRSVHLPIDKIFGVTTLELG